MVSVVIPEFRIEDMPLSCSWIIIGPPATGKCLGENIEVMMADGTTKLVQNIVDGDLIMGDDYTPRTVFGCSKGFAELYIVSSLSPIGIDEKYTVNKNHVLCLYLLDKNESTFLTMSVEEYLDLPKEKKKYLFGYRSHKDKQKDFYQIEVTPTTSGYYYGFELDGNGQFLLSGGTVTHNSTLMENFAYYLKHRYPVAKVFTGDIDGYKRFSKIFGRLYVLNYYDENEEANHIKRQKTVIMENGEKYTGNYAINIIDDIGDKPTTFNSDIMRGLFKIGSQHWAQLLMVGNQYAIDFKPAIRGSVSYVALGREMNEINRKKLYTNFGGIVGSYQVFCKLMDEITGDYTFLIIKMRSQSNKVEDCVMWYRTKVLDDWKFGCDEYKKWDAARYNSSYVEQIVV